MPKTCIFTIVANNYRHFARTMVALTIGTGNGLVGTTFGSTGRGTGASGGSGVEQATSVPRIADASRRWIEDARQG